MFGEVLKFEPSEASQKDANEVEGKLIEFPRPYKENPPEGAVEHILKKGGAHDAPVYLNEKDLLKAELDLDKVIKQHAEAMMALQKNLYNPDVQIITQLSKKINKLKDDIAITNKVNSDTAHQSEEEAA